MSLYRNSVISQVPINFRHANELRRTSITAVSEPGEASSHRPSLSQVKLATIWHYSCRPDLVMVRAECVSSPPSFHVLGEGL